jgi:hypothetical protein
MRTFTRRIAVLTAASLLAVACGGDGDAGDPTAQDTGDGTATEADDDETDDADASDDTADDADAGGRPAGQLDGAGATFPTPVFE